MFVALYNFFHRRKALLWLLFFGTLGLFSVLLCRLRFQEDVTSMLPDSRALRAMNDVISHTQAGEQVVFQVSFRDTTYSDPDSLIRAATGFCDTLQQKTGAGIDTIAFQAGGGYEEALVSVIQDNLPLLLNEQDYSQLDTLLQPQQIYNTMEANRKVLLSPASVVFKDLVARDPAGISRLAWGKLSALQFDPGYELYDGYLFANDQKLLTFFLKPAHKASETGKNAPLFGTLEQFTDEWEQAHPGIHLTYFGGPAVAAGNAVQMRHDTILTLSVTVVLLLALTFYFFRRKRTPLLLLVPVVYGAAAGLATVWLVQGSISVIALGAGAIVLGIAIDFSIHFLSHARHARDMRSTIRELTQPLTIGSFTTIAAFLSLRLVSTPLLRDLGLFAAASLAGAALCTLIFLPHFPLGIDHRKVKKNLFDKLAARKPERNKWLVLGIVLLTPVLLYFSFRVRFDDDLMHLNYLSPRLERAQEEVSKANASALSSVFVVAEGKDEEQALQKLETAAPLITSLQQEGKVRAASNPVSLLPSLAEQQRRIARWEAFWTPERRSAVLQIASAAAASLGFSDAAVQGFEATIGKAYAPFNPGSVQVLKSLFPGGFSVGTGNHYAIAALKVPAGHRKDVFKTLEQQSSVTVTDRQQGAAQLVHILNKDFNRIAIYSSLIVFLALLIGYGRFELAIISFLPMAISWVWILGLMGLFGLKFNIVNIIISTLIFGLGDDYAIFTMDGLIERYKYGNHKLDSVRAAVYISAATVFIGLGVLLLAGHPALKSISIISVLGMACVLFISQTLQPLLFNWFIQKRADRKFLPFTLWSFAKSVFAFAYFFTGSMVLTVLGIFFTKLWPFSKEKGKYYLHVWLSRYTWSMMYIMGNVKKRVIGRKHADFSKPAVYVANHSSFLDILVTTMLHPRLVLLTNRWVWRSPVFGAVVRMAEYYPVADGADDSLEPLKDLVKRGYSIVVFPEGTRSYSEKMQRFHKGAFFIAEKLKLNLVPVLLHGIGYTMQKGDFLLKDGTCSVHIYPPISPGDERYGTGYSERTKEISRWMRSEQARIRKQDETPSYFREQLLRSYTYKGPVLEWYCRVKTALEGNYERFHQLLPREGRFYDLGCGYGFMTYMLHWAAAGRDFTGVDYDEEKIETAQHNFLRDERVRFERADVTTYALDACDGIIISDVLHYLLPEQQTALLEKAVAALRPGGTLILRDGVSELEGRHKGTRMTELFSTRLLGFNKTRNELHFLSRAFIETFATRHQLSIDVLDLTKRTSNLIFILKKPEAATFSPAL